MNIKIKDKDISTVDDFLKRREEKRRILRYLEEEKVKVSKPLEDTPHSKDIIYDSRKLLRLFTDEQQIHQLSIKIDNAYRGLNVVSGHTWGIVRELLKLGLIKVSQSMRYHKTNKRLDYYVLTDSGWEIAHPIIYPPNLHEERKVESVVYRLLNEAQPFKGIIPKVVKT